MPGFLLLLQAVTRHIAALSKKNTCFMVRGLGFNGINVDKLVILRWYRLAMNSKMKKQGDFPLKSG
jgi:hypothetical protein